MCSMSATSGFLRFGCVALGAAFPAAVSAEMAFQPAGLLVATVTQALPGKPTAIVLGDGTLFVIAGTPEDSGHILRLSAETLAIEAEGKIAVAAQDLATTSTGDALFVIGADADHSHLYSLNHDLVPLSDVATEARFANPSLTWSGAGSLAISDFGAEKPRGDFRLVDTANPAAPVILPAPRTVQAARGATRGWYDAAHQAVFLAMADEPVLMVADVQTDRRITSLGFVLKSASALEPFTVDALLPDQRCDGGTDASFLISDRNRDRLMLVEYVDYFRTLILVTEVEPRLRLKPGAQAQSGQSGALRPSGLIASSCDRGVIWLGSLYSDEVIQYALNPVAQSLEKVGSIALPALPLSLLLSPDGQFGVALLADGTLVRFAAAGNAAPSLIGDPQVRDLQRLLTEKGYAVGSIDGFLGTRTQRALEQFSVSKGMTLDPTADFSAAIQALRDTKE